MKKSALAILFAVLILLGKDSAQAQLYLPEANKCNASAEEILSIIKSTYNMKPDPDRVLNMWTDKALSALR